MKRVLFFIFFLTFLYQSSFTQTAISGVINHYAKVTDIDTVCQIKLTVDDTTGFEIGMKAILVQMKGATIDESNTSSFGQILDMGGAGWYEKNEVDSVGEDCIFLKFKAKHVYDISGKVQLVTMPNFDSAIITDTLTADPWDGEKGGILAFTVENELTQNASIDVSGKGFRGGISVSFPGNCSWINPQNDFFYDLNSWRGAQKGEGIAEFILSKESGKGAQSTGGGGGNDHNSGGGGGANFSPGGIGGRNDEPSTFGCKGNHPGNGGTLVLDDIDRIFLGGGGGAGHGNNSVGTNGGNGGGIVVLETGSLTGNGYFIRANGETPPDGGGDGGGGGGGAGTQLVMLNTFNDLIHFEVKGGFGGLVDNNAQNRCFGPGGGGSGGRLLTNQGLGLWDINFNGGSAGQSINSTACPDSSNGADGGANGSYLLFYEIVESDLGFEGPLSIDVQPLSQEVCEGEQVIFTITINGNPSSYQWQVDDGNGFQNISDGLEYFGTGTDSLTVLNPTILMSGWIFQCVVSNECSTITSDVATLTVSDGANITNQPQSISICEGGTADFSILVNGSNVQYQWQVDEGSGFQNISDGAVYSGTMTNNLTVLNPSVLMSGWQFQCVITTDCGILTSDVATLQVTGSASITDQPQSIIVCEGVITIFEVEVVGSNAQYQWQVDEGSGFQNVSDGAVYSGTMTNTLTVLNPTILMSGWLFQCVITTDCGDLVSEEATIQVTESSNIISQPQSITVCEAESAAFTIEVTGTAIQYQWQVDDGSGFIDLSNNTIYSNVNTMTLNISAVDISMNEYFYQCQIIDDCGNVLISEAALLTVETFPMAQFDYLITGNSVNFNNLSSSNSLSYEWDFGDNSTSSQPNPVHDYSQSGIYTVQLIAFNNCGSDTTFQEVEISFLQVPTANFSLNNGTGCAPLLVQFMDQSSGDVDSWQWSFPGGNPNSSTEQNPLVVYETPGSFDVTFEVINTAGSDQITLENLINVELPIFAGFDYSVNENIVSFTNTTPNVTNFQWNFGDNTPESTEENPVHEYASPGVYNVTLVTTNPFCGSAVTNAVDVLFTGITNANDEALIKIFPNPVADILSIQFLEKWETKTVKLFHINGQKIIEKEIDQSDQLDLDVSKFSAGMYVLKIQIDDKIVVENVVKY